jgi:hypothetical protein
MARPGPAHRPARRLGQPWNLTPECEAHAIEVLFQLLDEFLADRENNEDDQVT